MQIRELLANDIIPQSEAKILLAHALGVEKSYLISHDDEEVEIEKVHAFKNLVQKRLIGMPVAQLTGSKEFYGREFEVNAHTLIPRPETEFVIEAAKEFFAAQQNLRILELGVGSGCILLTLLKEFQNSSGIGLDISQEALAIAKKNAYKLGIENFELIESNWLENLAQNGDQVEGYDNFDLIVSNPPYVEKDWLDQNQDNLGFEPQNALDGGLDGLDCYKEIAAQISGLNFSKVILEIGQNQEEKVKEIFADNGMTFVSEKADLAGIIRVLTFSK